MKKAFACLVVLLIFCAFSQDVQTPKILEAVAVPDPSEQGPTASNTTFSPMRELNPPISVPLPELYELYEVRGEFRIFPIAVPRETVGKSNLTKGLFEDRLFWLDNDRAIFIEFGNLYCLDLKASEMKTLLMTDFTGLWNYSRPAERFFSTAENGKAEFMSVLPPGIYFDENKKHFIVPTCIPPIEKIEEGRIQLYTFSCEDLSFNKTSFNPSHPEYFKYNDRYGGKPFVEVSRISPKGSFFHCSYYFDNIRDAYYNHDELALRNELALQIISLLHPEEPPLS